MCPHRASVPSRVAGIERSLSVLLSTLKGNAGSKEKEIVFQASLKQAISKQSPVLNTLEWKLSLDTIRAVSARGVREMRPFFQPLKYELEKRWMIYQFLYLPNSPKKDLLEFCKRKKVTDSLGWFTELNFKSTFSCIPENKKSQVLIAITWKNPERGKKSQLTKTVLPEGFRHSPTIFRNQLAKKLENWKSQQLRIAASNQQPRIATSNSCMQLTVSLFREHRRHVPCVTETE